MDVRPSLQELKAELAERLALCEGAEPGFGRFFAAAASSISDEDLEPLAISRLEGMLRAAYVRLGQRPPDGDDVRLVAADRYGGDRIEVFAAERPFLGDSLLAAVRAMGGEATLCIDMAVDYDPVAFRVLPDPIPGSRREAFLLVELKPLGDAARLAALESEVHDTLVDVAKAATSTKAMLLRLGKVAEDWTIRRPAAPAAPLAEAMQFIGWLADQHFIFLGMREYRLLGEGADARLLRLPDSDLGILADPAVQVFRQGETWVESTPRHLAWLTGPEPVIVTKANARSRVSRRVHLDYVGIKLYGERGLPAGELRIVGLFTPDALAAPPGTVPLIRQKVEAALVASARDPASPRGKALARTLEDWPRSELFQMQAADLAAFAPLVADLTQRPRLRVLPRIDPFDSFVSVLVFLSRERYDADLRGRIGAYLAATYGGRVSAWYPSFLDHEQVRLHFIIGRQGGETPHPARDELEARISDLCLGFADRLRAVAPNDPDLALYAAALPPGYQKSTSTADALIDIALLRTLSAENSLDLRLSARLDWDMATRLKAYHFDGPIALSDRVPVLENFGFRVIDEATHTISLGPGRELVLHDMLLDSSIRLDLADRVFARRLETAILRAWRGELENDALNRLTANPGLDWTEVEVLRALCHYSYQAFGKPSRAAIAGYLAAAPDVAGALVALFNARFDPALPGSRDRAEAAASRALEAAIVATVSLEADQIFRRLAGVVRALVRTNAFQRDAAGTRRPALALKLDSSTIEGLPEPRPWREIFVSSPRVEGVHLRMGPLARGGLRWSDRAEDFRAEALALVKAQQVKNAIIVPAGAKGAFVPRLLGQLPDREAREREGALAYRIFVSSLLDVTDTIGPAGIVGPPDVLVRDAADPYLVVAADKGTARFSDAANAIAAARGFWLDDAFASGGSAGYDHKAMGITARGAFAAVKRHFRELDREIDSTPFTAVGVGDMSGDVFGNGMLLSPQLRLVAAFDHRDIFVDPDPDPAVSFAERARLFTLPRSSWQDYDPAALSKGGGVYSRSVKTVALFAEARRVLGLGPEPVTPDEVIRAILRAEVDLIWFGGIGTYVRATGETDTDVGDRANDPVRITGADLRARVVGEGANLAMTQRGRIEYALKGGLVNTDAIDNSGGVNASDLEVNIKIALGPLLETGELTRAVRDEFLRGLTDEVSTLVIANTIAQTRAISVEAFRRDAAVPEHQDLIDRLDAAGELHRIRDHLPDRATLADRRRIGLGLTRPEIAELMAHAKNRLKADILAAGLPDDPRLEGVLSDYFPKRLGAAFGPAIRAHRLRREIIATVLGNSLINMGGPAIANEIGATTGAAASEIALASLVARDVFGLDSLLAGITALDGTVPGRTQLALCAEVQRLFRRLTLWFLRHARLDLGVGAVTGPHGEALAALEHALSQSTRPGIAAELAARRAELAANGAGPTIAQRLAELDLLTFAPDIALVAGRIGRPLPEIATSYLDVLEFFGLAGLSGAGFRLVPAEAVDRMALDRALSNLARAQRDLTADNLAAGGFESWLATRRNAAERARSAVADLAGNSLSVSRLSVAAGLLSDLAQGL